MSTAIKRRLDQLEARHSPIEPRPIFFTVVCKKTGDPNDGWRTPIKGWRHDKTDIMRLEGETDESLQQRALDHAKDQGNEQAVMIFFQIRDSDRKVEENEVVAFPVG